MPFRFRLRPGDPLSARRLLFLSAACMTLLSACGKPDYQTLDHGDGTFADLQGQHVLINYWAAWCKPCIEEIPELNAFATDHAGSVVVLGVNYDGVDQALLREQAAEFDITFPVLLNDPAPLLGYERPHALPSTFVLAPDGSLKTVLRGAQTEETLAAAIAHTDGGSPEIEP